MSVRVPVCPYRLFVVAVVVVVVVVVVLIYKSDHAHKSLIL